MYLVIGGSGFLGSYIIKNILEQTQDDVMATYTSNEPTKKNDRVQWIKLDVCDVEALELLNKQIDPQTKIIYLAALTGVDEQLYEAAKIDGANKMQQLWNITISKTILSILNGNCIESVISASIAT